ncbi:hypothetical protein NP493_964g00038 [Ridgeia piscesae]|uniref:Fibrinogen C-terminal domain-containing protein n=1 Tax=Ridgeia piscesae TaxID=27915 RepID=A0AAD9NJK7_RIDPI|nr:hypothetical protein NP493_964g00038 [Ridgeia piscesae]
MLLRFELVSNSNYTAIAEYIDFTLGDESSDYTATFGPAVLRSGITDESWALSNGTKFGTKNHDNNPAKCSSLGGGKAGGWWWSRPSTLSSMCSLTNLNGVYDDARLGPHRMVWHGLEEPAPLRRSRMMVRPMDFDVVACPNPCLNGGTCLAPVSVECSAQVDVVYV